MRFSFLPDFLEETVRSLFEGTLQCEKAHPGDTPPSIRRPLASPMHEASPTPSANILAKTVQTYFCKKSAAWLHVCFSVIVNIIK